MASYHVKYICFPTKKRTEFCVITATLTDIFNDDFCAYRNTLCYLKNRLIFTFPRQYKESLVAGEEHFCNVCNLFESCLGYSDTLWQFYNILQIVLKVLFFTSCHYQQGSALMFLEILFFTQKTIPSLQICGFPFTLTRKVHFKGVLVFVFSPCLTGNLCQTVHA